MRASWSITMKQTLSPSCMSYEMGDLSHESKFHVWYGEPTVTVPWERPQNVSFHKPLQRAWPRISFKYGLMPLLPHNCWIRELSWIDVCAFLYIKCRDTKMTTLWSDIKMYNLSYSCNAWLMRSYCSESQSSELKDKYYSVSYWIKYIISQVMETDWLNKF